MPLRCSVASRPSQIRRSGTNQDAAVVLELQGGTGRITQQAVLACLADGMSTLAEPETAARIAVTTAARHYLSVFDHTTPNIADAIIAANDAICDAPNGHEMGSTLTCVLVEDNRVQVAHIGDCRVYLIANKRVTCLTADHTRLALKLGVSIVSNLDAKSHRSSKSLTKSLGEKRFAGPYVDSILSNDIGDDDIVVCCSDGVWTEIEGDELLVVARETPIEQLSQRLVELALARDPTDDATAIAITRSVT